MKGLVRFGTAGQFKEAPLRRALAEIKAETDRAEEDWAGCDKCNGDGFIPDCPDDICNSLGDCIHGDNIVCPECHGECEIYVGPDADTDQEGTA